METLIQFKTAKLAQEKGVDIKNLISDIGKNWYTRSGKFNGYSPKEPYYVCSQSVLADWLLDNYKLHINICALGLKKWSFMLEELSIDGTLCKGGDLGIQNYGSKQEAFERGLFDTLSLV